MGPNETIAILEGTLRECFEKVPLGALDEPDTWADIVAQFVFKCSQRGLYIVESEVYDALRTEINSKRAAIKRVTYDIPDPAVGSKQT